MDCIHESVMPHDDPCELISNFEVSFGDHQSVLYRALFVDLASHFPNHAYADFLYLITRYRNEGDNFTLSALPSLGKAFETCIITGEKLIIPSGFEAFAQTGQPKFLRDLFAEVIDESGLPISDNTDKTWSGRAWIACQFIRQVCLMFSKVRSDASLSSKSDKAIHDFLDRVTTVKELNLVDSMTRDTIKEAHELLRRVFSCESEALSELKSFQKEPWGRHGPGAVACKEGPGEKWSFMDWPGLPKQLFVWAEGKAINSLFIPKQPASRVIAVPKDFRGPRVICIEPKENQFAQQGIWDILQRHVHECALTRRSINFRSVAKNRKSCYNYNMATIDLKDASDNLSLTLSRVLLPKWVFSLFTRYRTRRIKYKGTSRPYSAFATMGSAVCFPLQTLVFWALSLGAMLVIRNSFPLRQRKHLDVSLQVFGDDIIVPMWCADALCKVLQDCGLIVNSSKTCIFSPVRESCGEWVYAGRNCPVFKFKSAQIDDDLSWLAWRDQFEDLSGLVNLPALNESIAELLWFKARVWKTRYNKTLDRLEVKAPRVIRLGARKELTDYAGLYAWHVGNDRIPYLKGTRERVVKRWQDYRVFFGSDLIDHRPTSHSFLSAMDVWEKTPSKTRKAC